MKATFIQLKRSSSDSIRLGDLRVQRLGAGERREQPLVGRLVVGAKLPSREHMPTSVAEVDSVGRGWSIHPLLINR